MPSVIAEVEANKRFAAVRARKLRNAINNCHLESVVNYALGEVRNSDAVRNSLEPATVVNC